jgi:hypothetical protein
MSLQRHPSGQIIPVALDYDDKDYAADNKRHFKFSGVHTLTLEFNEVGQELIKKHVEENKKKRQLITPVKGIVPTGEAAEKDVQGQIHKFPGRKVSPGGLIVP